MSECQSFVGKKDGERQFKIVCRRAAIANNWKICSLCEHFMRSQGIVHALNFVSVRCILVRWWFLMPRYVERCGQHRWSSDVQRCHNAQRLFTLNVSQYRRSGLESVATEKAMVILENRSQNWQWTRVIFHLWASQAAFHHWNSHKLVAGRPRLTHTIMFTIKYMYI